jgi:hypothetical protein
MLYALGTPVDATLDAIVSTVGKDKTAKQKLARKDLTWSSTPAPNGKHLLLVKEEPALTRPVWAAALKAGLDARGGVPPEL